MANSRRSLFASPSIVSAAFVFDEIHQYGERLFGELLQFLDCFRGAPILLMTASLPESHLTAIRELLHRSNRSLEVIEGPADLEGIRRYALEGPVCDPPWESVAATLNRGGRVLWVGNTVRRCVGFAKEAADRGLCPLVYHSRYRYCDRVKKHNTVIGAFSEGASGPALAVTTQVCEVSLDLSADLLVTDLAPIPALIQRMGRLNRRVTPENPGTPKPAIVVDRDSAAPYGADEFSLDKVRGWVTSLAGRPVSQVDLTGSFEALARDHPVAAVASPWLCGGPFAWQEPVREAGGVIPVIRYEDEPSCLDQSGWPDGKMLTRFSIPMTLGPVAREIVNWRRLGYVFVAPPGRILYSEQWGAAWAGD
jgi:CRISPR-associated endonuclease/helicase Cas3